MPAERNPTKRVSEMTVVSDLPSFLSFSFPPCFMSSPSRHAASLFSLLLGLLHSKRPPRVLPSTMLWFFYMSTLFLRYIALLFIVTVLWWTWKVEIYYWKKRNNNFEDSWVNKILPKWAGRWCASVGWTLLPFFSFSVFSFSFAFFRLGLKAFCWSPSVATLTASSWDLRI